MDRDVKQNPDAALPGLTVQREVPTVWLQAQLIGTLEIDTSTSCVVVRTAITTAPGAGESLVDIDVAWPPGWSVELRDGTLALIDAAGQLACRTGDEISVGGGFVDIDRIDAVPCTGQERIFQASELTRL